MITEHEVLVENSLKQGIDILKTITPERINLWHLATIVAGEGAELLDQVKKHVIYNRPLDMENMLEEMGDVEYGLEGLRQELGFTREQVLQYNIDKLNKRYKNGYSDKAAIERADKC